MQRLRHLPWIIMLTVALAPLRPSAVSADEKDGTSKQLNQKVVEFARKNIGKQVGKGECAHLAIEALRAAGANTFENTKEYIWGKLIEKYEDAQPGDIIQFRDAKLHASITTKKGVVKMGIIQIAQHTVVVSANLGNGKLKSLEQNGDGEKFVEEGQYDLASKTEGKIWIYRPVKK